MLVRCLYSFICSIMLISILGLTACQKQETNATDNAQEKPGTEAVQVAGGKDKGKDILLKRPKKFTYVAMCQMRCAKLRTTDINNAFKNGNIKTSKKWLGAKPCPFYAIESQDSEGKKITIVVSVCNKATRIVRVMKEGVNCNCQSQEKKS